MPDTLNRVRNSDFSAGSTKPQSWTWSADDNAPTWTYAQPTDQSGRELAISSDHESASGFWQQRIRCKAEQFYRIEAVVSADCTGDHPHAGAALHVQPITGASDTNGRVRLAGTLRSDGRMTLRAFYRTPPGTKSLMLQIGMQHAVGRVIVHSAYLVLNIEPDLKSHPLALPPLPHAYPAPRSEKRICVCDDQDRDRPLVDLLRKRFRPGAVQHTKAKALKPGDVKSGALIVAGENMPVGLRSLAALERFAEKRIVIVSLPAFAKVAGADVNVRAIAQRDDTLHAKVCYANFITRGFALEDVFPFAWHKPVDRRIQMHRQFSRGPAFRRWQKKHAYETVLLSETDSDRTSESPLCLHKPTRNGGVIVCDLEPIEAADSSRGEANLAVHLLLNMLGADQTQLGQFTAPEYTEREWYTLLKELRVRYPAFTLTGRKRHDHVIELGGRQETLGLPLVPRPLILIRTGLTGADVAGIYGVIYWLKQLVRPQPHALAYVTNLIKRFRIAWVPLCAPWQCEHWNETHAAETLDMEGEFERGSVAAVIDITDNNTRKLRVTYHKKDATHARRAKLLRNLADCFATGRYFYRAPAEGLHVGDRAAAAWRTERLLPSVVVDPSDFPSQFHQCATDAGARLIRIEIPGSNSDFMANSIWRTETAALTLEHVVGTEYGLLAVNRFATPISFGGHRTLEPGQAIDLPSKFEQNGRAMRAG